MCGAVCDLRFRLLLGFIHSIESRADDDRRGHSHYSIIPNSKNTITNYQVL